MDVKPYMTRFGFGHRDSKHIVVEQRDKLWIAFASEGAGMFMMSTASVNAGLLEVNLMDGGESIPYMYEVTESLITLTSAKGTVRMAIDVPAAALRFEGEGVGLRLDSKNSPQNATTLNTPEGVVLSLGGGRYFVAAKQGKITFDDTWMLSSFHSVPPVLDVAPDGGKLSVIAYDLPADTDTPPITLTLDECAKANADDFAAFKNGLVAVPAEWNELREKIAYIMWLNQRKNASGAGIMVFNQLMTSATNANMLSVASLAFTDVNKAAGYILAQAPETPQAQAFAILRLFDDGIFKNLSRKTAFDLYQMLNEQYSWWIQNRTYNNSQLFFYAYRYEAISTANTLFGSGEPVASPDINAYMILACEAMARLADHVYNGAEAAKWRERIKPHVTALVANLWNGSAFTGKNVYSGEVSEADAQIAVMPLILGKYLPEEVLGDLAAKVVDDPANEFVLDSTPGAMILYTLINARFFLDKAQGIVKKALAKAQSDGVTDPFFGAALLALANKLL